MAANMAAETQKYAYLSSQVSYNDKWSVDFNNFQVKESNFLSGSSVGLLLSKMTAKMADQLKIYVHLSS